MAKEGGGMVSWKREIGAVTLYVPDLDEARKFYSDAFGLDAQAMDDTLRGSARMRSLRFSRMCYDHLAGVVGVAVTEALTARQAIGETDGAWVLGSAGAAVFGDLGIDVAAVPHRTWPLLRPCMDWTERRHHLAGGLGAALAA
jgi:catechol 2,3-dioxygenase-like lactoylglutathione lyase family enzyme